MKILLTGATGYIGKRILPALLQEGHEVVCLVRDAARLLHDTHESAKLSVVEADLMKPASMDQIPKDIDVAYYLVHSMGSGSNSFSNTERTSAENFAEALQKTHAKQIIYLSGIVNSDVLSAHLASRKVVEDILRGGAVPVTALRAGIIIGSGSASFEIIRDLVEKLPVMVAPKWLKSQCQPIAIRNVIEFLIGVLQQEELYDRHIDIYGPDLLTYQQMLEDFASVRNLKRKIYIVPVLTPRLSSYWLYLITSTSFSLARHLVDSMRIDVVPVENEWAEKLGINLISYRDAIKLAFGKIEQNLVLSTWKEAGTRRAMQGLSTYVEVPAFGVLTDRKTIALNNPDETLKRIFAIGGRNGWYYGNWLWQFRGFLDRLFGGVGLRRGRRNALETAPDEVLDFWRVLLSSRQEKRLLLYAEMRLPGEAWLEFRINEKEELEQIATFRPHGIAGRLYWYAMLPFHLFLFRGMIRNIAK
ncbi:SDR family oxidoreductase [Sphingobacterium sp. lm-10]|uniref:SDR family oxidoreductase n=1 Tax=Sphingobacterium sp. lm-10 TaxID=2944904 RepID=UPI0020222CDE|nr:SDR family oxidoreductase [Sphingobacterium sp. lm-10]MCL7986486.1 SDR family oxidoreductase [Sphingobacterium sp. lm-10]